MNDETEAPEIEIVPLATFDDLPVDEKAAGTVIKGPGTDGKAVWSQYVEPERDGQPWCSWEEAEAMLVASAQQALRGQGGIKPGGYRVSRDDAKSILTLELV